MKTFCGTDVIEVKRIKEAIEENKAFLDKVFTHKEIEYCNKKNKEVSYRHFAGRFAAKEAIYKAISKIIENREESISWNNIEILNDKKGRPYVEFKTIKKINFDIDISISHCNDTAVAMAVVNLK